MARGDILATVRVGALLGAGGSVWGSITVPFAGTPT